jgi:hypothetical protein
VDPQPFYVRLERECVFGNEVFPAGAVIEVDRRQADHFVASGAGKLVEKPEMTSGPQQHETTAHKHKGETTAKR